MFDMGSGVQAMESMQESKSSASILKCASKTLIARALALCCRALSNMGMTFISSKPGVDNERSTASGP